MKKNIFLIAFFYLSLVSTSKAQSLSTLDEKNGFKTIKLDDPISKYTQNIKLYEIDKDDNTSSYSYTPDDNNLYSVFDLKMDEINLFFDNNTNKLIGINLVKYYYASNQNHFQNALKDNRSILETFISLFGIFTGKIEQDSKRTDVGVYWDGKKVRLQTSASYYGQNKGSQVSVLIFKQSFLNTKIEIKTKSGF